MLSCLRTILIAVLMVGATTTASQASDLKKEMSEVVASFVGDDVSLSAQELPVTAESESMSGERVGDMLIGLAFLALIYFLGVFFKKSGLPGLEPAVFTGVVMGILMFTVVNTEYWQMESVTADSEGLTIIRYTSSDSSIKWSEVKDIRMDDGSAFPVVTDDASLVLIDEAGEEYPVPRFLVNSDAIASVIKTRLGN